MSLFAIVLTSMVMTVKVILLSASAKTAVVENKAKEVLSVFGLDLSKILGKDDDSGRVFSEAVDPWAFATDISAYNSLMAATVLVYVLASVSFVVWHFAVDRSVPFGLGRSLPERLVSSPVAWFVPGVNLVQPPRILVSVYDILVRVDPAGTSMSGARALVWSWWALLLVGGVLVCVSSISAPLDLDAGGIAKIVVGPLALIGAAALSVVIVRDVSERIKRCGRTEGGDGHSI